MIKYILLSSVLLHISYSTSAQTWNQLNDSVTYYYNSGEYKKAIPIAKKAISTARNDSGELYINYANSISYLGELYKNTGHYFKAETLFLEACELYGKLYGKTHYYYAYSINNLAILYYRMAKYEKAEVLYLQSLAIQKNQLGENNRSYIHYLHNLALLYTDMDKYEKAESLFIQALAIGKSVLGENDLDYATMHNNIAALYKLMGNYNKAEPLYIQAITRNKLKENHPEYATPLRNMAGLYAAMGNYEKAEPLFIQTLAIQKKTLGENDPNYGTTLSDMALFYVGIGNYEKAELLFIQAIAIGKNVLGENHPDYATTLNNLALLYTSMGIYKKAESLFIQSMSIRKKLLGENSISYAGSLNNLARLYEKMNLYKNAETILIQAKEIFKVVVGENHPHYAASLNNLAVLYKKIGNYEKAELFIIQAIAIRKKVLGDNHPYYASSLNNQAELYESMGKFEKAESLLTTASKIHVRNLVNMFSTLSEKEKGNYLANSVFLNNTNNSFLYNYSKASSSFYKDNYNLQLLLKSLSLADTKNVLDAVRNSKDPAISKMFIKWQDQKIILAKQYSLPVTGRKGDLKEIEIQTETLEKELTRKSSEFRSQQNAIHISLHDIQKNLQQDEIAIEFISFQLYHITWTDSIIYAAYILRKNDSVPIFIPLCEEKQLQQLFASAGKATTASVSAFYRGVGTDEENISVSKGDSLYKLIWQPLEPYLKGINKISYSPAGKLYTIAFNALPTGDGKILMDKYELQQYTSTRQITLRGNENEKSTPKSIALFGDATFTLDSLQLVKSLHANAANSTASTNIYTPQTRGSNNAVWSNLPGTATEVNKIQNLFSQNKIAAKTFVQQQASEENFKSLSANSPQVLHLATHGFFLPEADKKRKDLNDGNVYSLAEDPLMRSGILLSGANYAWSGKTPINGVEDGIATAYEISQLDLSKTELVVLSACETALGDIKGSEGVFGLQRAFKMAGVNKLIVSLWQVPDKETSELMTVFYSNWLGGKTIENAFYTAQSEMRKKYAPFYWAAFVLVE